MERRTYGEGKAVGCRENDELHRIHGGIRILDQPRQRGGSSARESLSGRARARAYAAAGGRKGVVRRSTLVVRGVLHPRRHRGHARDHRRTPSGARRDQRDRGRLLEKMQQTFDHDRQPAIGGFARAIRRTQPCSPSACTSTPPPQCVRRTRSIPNGTGRATDFGLREVERRTYGEGKPVRRSENNEPHPIGRGMGGFDPPVRCQGGCSGRESRSGRAGPHAQAAAVEQNSMVLSALMVRGVFHAVRHLGHARHHRRTPSSERRDQHDRSRCPQNGRQALNHRANVRSGLQRVKRRHHILRYFGPLPPSLGVHRGPKTSVALQSIQFGAFTRKAPSTRSYTPAGHMRT